MRTSFISIVLLIISCVGKSIQPENYYFPIKNFFNEHTYCYINKKDTTDKSYWKMKTSISNSDTIFETSIFDSQNRIIETMTEKVLNGNSKVVKYILYNYNQQGDKLSSNCKILDSLVFKINQKVEEEIQWRVNFKDFNSLNNCELFKIRILKSNNNQQKIFTDLMRFMVLETGQGYQYHLISVYQKEKGLVSYKMVLPGGKEKDYILANIK